MDSILMRLHNVHHLPVCDEHTQYLLELFGGDNVPAEGNYYCIGDSELPCALCQETSPKEGLVEVLLKDQMNRGSWNCYLIATDYLWCLISWEEMIAKFEATKASRIDMQVGIKTVIRGYVIPTWVMEAPQITKLKEWLELEKIR